MYVTEEIFRLQVINMGSDFVSILDTSLNVGHKLTLSVWCYKFKFRLKPHNWHK